MEGMGSRLGRASSRYGSAPVFTGPVRRWQKQWVHVPSSSISYNHFDSTTANNTNTASAVRLRRWTPLPPNHPAGHSDDVTQEPPRRKLRYTPIVVLEEKKKQAEKADHEVKAQASEKKSEATRKESNNGTIDLDIALKGYESDSSDKEADWVKAARTGFAGST